MRGYLRKLLSAGDMLREVIQEALVKARHTLQDSLSMGFTKIEKRGWSGDYSRQFDILAEKTIIEVIKSRLNKVYIISEEIGEIPCNDPDFYVLIDPVDGSTNALRGIPFYSSTIAISKSLRAEDVIAVGVMDHQTGKMYLGDREHGVTIDGNAPSMNKNIFSLKDALILVDPSSMRTMHSRNLVDWCARIVARAGHVRALASASLEIAYILEGKADAFICLSPQLRLMDFYASATLLKWAGGTFKLIGGKGELSLREITRFGMIAASTESLLEEILSLQ